MNKVWGIFVTITERARGAIHLQAPPAGGGFLSSFPVGRFFAHNGGCKSETPTICLVGVGAITR